jgi:hypothetical protein
MIKDSCEGAKLKWQKFKIGDTIKIVIKGVG